MTTDTQFDTAKAHRWFAVEFNNHCWDLIERPDLSRDELDQLLHTAHASCHHWQQAGEPVHHYRAYTLVAVASFRAGLPETALHWAKKCERIEQEQSPSVTAFDRAMVHAVMSVANASLSNPLAATRHRAIVNAELESCSDVEQHAFQRVFRKQGK